MAAHRQRSLVACSCSRRTAFVLPLAVATLVVCGGKLAAVIRRPSGRVRGRLVKDLQTYALLPGEGPTFLEEVDPSNVTKKAVVSIDFAHRNGLLHRGALMLVSDANGEILLLQRKPHLATCPNSWGGVGEHSIRDEAPLATASRGILEELGQAALDEVVSMHRLTTHPFYMKRPIGSTGRIDHQLLYSWEVRLGKAKDDVRLDLDEEVADHRWIGVDDYLAWIERDLQRGDDGPREFCCDVVAKIRRFEAERLKEYRSKLPHS